MPNAALSNRERKAQRKVTPKPPRYARGDGVVRVAAVTPIDPEMDADRDGLQWLIDRKRLSSPQGAAGLWLSDRLRDAGEVALRCSLETDGVGGSATSRSPSPLVSMTSAKREMLLVRHVIFGGVPDMILVVEGVCGARHTLRYLAGGDKHRARDLEVTLKLALDLVAAKVLKIKIGD